MALHLVAAAQSHAGRLRRVNQDAWSYSVDAGVFVVCDGMGGAAGGDVASHAAAEAFLEHMTAASRLPRTQRSVAQAICAANRRVFARAAHEPALHGMGTTLVALVAHGEHQVMVAHVGDSRCYQWHGGALVRCTEDHSLVEEQKRMGVISEEQAAASPMRNVITRAVGTCRSVAPEVHTFPAEPGDLFLLCSDGLSRELPDPAIALLLGRYAPAPEACNGALIGAALSAGGRDNVTCITVAIG